jgi:diguanylate cyclase (GGDEF)-like protein
MPVDRPVRRRPPATTPQAGNGRSRRRTIVITLLLAAIVVAIGYVDYISGPEIGFSLFYLAPVVGAAWYAGRRASVIVALIAALCWFTADYLIRVSLGLSLWNGLTRLVIYTGQGLLVATLRDDRRREARLARTDSITGLPNSRAFHESLERAIGHDVTVSAMIVDLDNFKRVNDVFGHPAGDAVLRRVGETLSKAVRATDVVARIGGDEFAIFLEDVDEPACSVIAERIIAGIRSIAADYPGTALGGSVGVAFTRHHPAASELIKHADDAMYEAKQREKGTFVVRAV